MEKKLSAQEQELLAKQAAVLSDETLEQVSGGANEDRSPDEVQPKTGPLRGRLR